jgi:DNA repair protein RecO (recombination protein O)
MIGFVIKKKPIGESDRLVWLLTQELGLIRAIAKGARKPGNSLSGRSELLLELNFELRPTKNLPYLTDVEIMTRYPNILKSLDALEAVYYSCEVLLKTTEEEALNQNGYFTLLKDFYSRLDAGLDPIFVTNLFELSLHKLWGSSLEWNTCVNCGAQADTPFVYIHYLDGGFVCHDCSPLKQTPKVKIPLEAIAYFNDLKHDAPSSQHLGARQLLKTYTNLLIKHVLGF